MMPLLTIAIFVLLVSLLSGSAFMTIFGKRFSRKISMCPKCSSANIISEDISNSCLKVKCKNEACDCCSLLPVRPSALSLFGLAQLLLTIVVGVLGFELSCHSTHKALIVFMFIIIGGVFARFLVRSIAFFLLGYGISPIWKKEIVSYLDSPFSKRDEDE